MLPTANNETGLALQDAKSIKAFAKQNTRWILRRATELAGELKYLASLLRDPDLKLAHNRYVTLKAIKGKHQDYADQTTDASSPHVDHFRALRRFGNYLGMQQAALMGKRKSESTLPQRILIMSLLFVFPVFVIIPFLFPLWILTLVVALTYRSIWLFFSGAATFFTINILGHLNKQASSTPSSLLTHMEHYVSKKQPVIILGKPGSGKSATLEYMAYRLALRAFIVRTIAALFSLLLLFSLVSCLSILARSTNSVLGFISNRWPIFFITLLPKGSTILLLSTMGSLLAFSKIIFKHFPLPVLIELRRYEGEPLASFLAKHLLENIGIKHHARDLPNDAENLIWLLDGVNEIKNTVSTQAAEEWRAHFQPGKFFHRAPVVFTSRSEDDLNRLFRIKEIVTVLPLDDDGVRRYLQAYGSDNVNRDFAVLEERQMLGDQGLGRNPYWLKMLVENGLDLHSKGKIFASFVNSLLKRELEKGLWVKDASPLGRPVYNVPIDHELAILGDIALFMHESQQIGALREEAKNKVKQALGNRSLQYIPEDVLVEAEAATLMKTSTDRADFTHQLVQDFFAAYALQSLIGESEIELAGRLPLLIANAWWWMTLLMLGDLVSLDRNKFIRAVLGDGTECSRVLIAMALLKDLDKPSATTPRSSSSSSKIRDEITQIFVTSLDGGITDSHLTTVHDLWHKAGGDLSDFFGEIFEHLDSKHKKHILSLLQAIGSVRSAEVLISFFDDAIIGMDAMNACAMIGPAASESLVIAIRSASQTTRRSAAEALRQIGSPCVEQLIKVLQEHDFSASWYAVRTLGEIADRRAVEPLITTLLVHARTRRISQFTSSSSTSSAISDLREQYKNTRIYREASDGEILAGEIIHALQLLKDRGAADTLLAMLWSPSELIRLNAIIALGNFADPRAVSPLTFKLQDNTLSHGEIAAMMEALGKIPEMSALQALLASSPRGSEIVADTLANAISNIIMLLMRRGDAQRISDLLISALASSSYTVRESAARALELFGKATQIDLRKSLDNPSPAIRQRIIELLAKVAPPALEELVNALHDEDLNVRAKAAALLGNTNDTSAVTALISAAEKEIKTECGWNALESLGSIGGATALTAITRALHVPNSSMRWRAVEILGDAKTGKYTSVIVAALNDEDGFVRIKASEALAKLPNHHVLPELRSALQREGDPFARRKMTEAINKITRSIGKAAPD